MSLPRSAIPGSWINADFYIWAGHRDDHRAWQQLAAARRAFDAHGGSLSPARRALAWEELLVAEGSDWFWWYGDDHSSDHDAEFDDLFRRHLRNVHEALGLEPPAELCLTNISTTSAGAASTRPTALTTPITRGVGSFAGWVGSVSVGHSDGAMHGVSRIERLRMAINRRHLFLRLEGDALRQRLLSDELGLSLLVDGPTPQWLAIPRTPANGIRWVADDAVEVVVPFEAMRRQAGDPVRFTVVVLDVAGRVLEQYPRTGVVALEVPSRHLNAIHWRV